MAGVSAGKWANYEGGARGGAVALLSGFFRGGRQRRRFRGCCTGGKKCVNLQVIVPGRFGARKMTQENISGHKDITERAMTGKEDKARNAGLTPKEGSTSNVGGNTRKDGSAGKGGGARARRIDDGVVVGGLMSLTALAIVWTTHCVWFGALAAVAAIGVPVAMHCCSRRWLAAVPEQPHPAVALMHGFTTVFCGCILLGLTVYLYLGYAEPQWTAMIMQRLATEMADSGIGRAAASLLAHGHIPSAIQSSMIVMLLAMFGGCSATMLLTPLALRSNAKRRKPNTL